MNTVEILNKFEDVTNHYLHELEGFSMEQLLQKPSEDEWSIGQMYLHLIQSARYMQLGSVEKCRQGGPAVAEAGSCKTEIGQAIFAQGSLPPVRVKVPASPAYTPAQPDSKEQLRDGLNGVLAQMKELEPTLDDIPAQHTAPHPAFGDLTAKEWFAIVEMHYRHHLLQLNRLKG
ncbi:DinB family protein [Brevibacillus sp. 179-C9.3 HS]|uniref:DinB family protein n=1 Tax=unclassified Brevibacillus TaxID=2684853 RepID=UPI0039A17826